ncbi:MAG: EsaB/YukD family protein [Nocardioidaceae bacterium]|nr:EsaB/YukD family protein [Nocardioidaceae bacterium]
MSTSTAGAPLGAAAPGGAFGGALAVSVHGPRGVVDLTLPESATIAEIASAYAATAALPSPPVLVLASGRSLPPDATIEQAGLAAGAVLVAVEDTAPVPDRKRRTTPRGGPEGGGLVAGCGVALALLAVVAATASGHRTPVAVVLAIGAVLGVMPIGRRRVARVVTAPALAGAACVLVAWDPAAARLPTVLGAGALAAAVVAAVGRSLAAPGTPVAEVLRVWIWSGLGWFVLAAACALTGASAPTPWAIGFLLAVLAARWVPVAAVDVPDHYLIDLERLAITAWSARERPVGRRGRIVVPPEYVGDVAARGGRTVLASCAAILVVTATTGPLLLTTDAYPVDLIGSRCLVALGGGALLLAARGYRHVLARRMLRLAGVVGLLLVGGDLVRLSAGHPELRAQLTVALLAVAALLIVLGVALGRGWRSAWWARQAEVAEVLCGSGSVAAVVVASGLFRHLWEHNI